MMSTHLWKMLTAALILGLCWIQGCDGNTQLTMTMQFDWLCKPQHITPRGAYIQIRKFEQHPNDTQVLATAYQNSYEVSSKFLSRVPGAEAGGSVGEGFLNLTYQTVQRNSSETFQCVWAYNDEDGYRHEATPHTLTVRAEQSEGVFGVKENFKLHIKMKASLSHGLFKTEPFFVTTDIENSNKKIPLWQCEKAKGVCNLTGVALNFLTGVALNFTCSQESPQSDKFNCTNLPYHEVRFDNSQDGSNGISLGVVIPIATICCFICFVAGIAIGIRSFMKNAIANTALIIQNICSKSIAKEPSVQNSDEKPNENKEKHVAIEISRDDSDDNSGNDEIMKDEIMKAVQGRQFKGNKYRAPLNL